jgi:hypothetical protein
MSEIYEKIAIAICTRLNVEPSATNKAAIEQEIVQGLGEFAQKISKEVAKEVASKKDKRS